MTPELEQQLHKVAIFDGCTVREHDGSMFYVRDHQLLTIGELQYHTNWQSLMPVVEKIERDCDVEVYISNGTCDISKPEGTALLVAVCYPEAKSKIEAVFLAVVQFIDYLTLNNIHP